MTISELDIGDIFLHGEELCVVKGETEDGLNIEVSCIAFMSDGKWVGRHKPFLMDFRPDTVVKLATIS